MEQNEPDYPMFLPLREGNVESWAWECCWLFFARPYR